MMVAFSNCTSILSGIFVGFLVPKILSINDYGMYKTFTLYMTYVGFFSLGIIDGIVLQYGGVDYESLDRRRFRSYFLWYNIVHLCFAVLLLFLGFLAQNVSVSFILLMLSVNMWAVNVLGYYQQISQITQRFKEFSLRKILQNIFNIISVLVLYFLHRNGVQIRYSYYIVLIVIVNLMLSIWYFFTYHDISFGERYSLKETKRDIFGLMKNGFPLLFANLLSTLILTLDRQFVNLLFDKEIYAVYAFAYNMLAIVTVATSAFSVVLYPALKRTSNTKLKDSYSGFIQIIEILVGFALFVYFPLDCIVNQFLPNYIDSLPIFRIVFPGLIISSAITVIMHNYYKTMGQNITYFKRSIVVLVISGIANVVAFGIFRTTYSISVASIVVMVFWYIYIESYFVKVFQYKRYKSLFYVLIVMGIFYFTTSISQPFIGCLAYLGSFGIITYIFFRKDAKDLIGIIK